MVALTGAEDSTLVRRAMISAACALDDGSYAKTLWELSRGDSDANQWVQRALISWRSDVAIDFWREVLRDPNSPAIAIRLALEGIGVIGTADDQSLLVEILESESASIEQRVLASNALGNLQTSGLTPLARKYLESKLPDRDLVAVSLLQKHSDDGAMRVVTKVLDTGNSPAKRIAATCLVTHAPRIAVEMAVRWSTDPDAHFRRLALEVTLASNPIKGIDLATRFLRDEDVGLRSAARCSLRESAMRYREAVDASIADVWIGNNVCSLEQAIVLAVELADESRCERLIELLDNPQAEVHMHAAWALRDLSGTGPILEKILAYATKMTDALENGAMDFGRSEIIKLSFLLESFGRHRYEPAYRMLTKYIPKNGFRMQNLTRASAIWSIGQLRKDADDPSLRAELRGRINDMPPNNPENALVRFACMIALGEFAFRDSLEVIDPFVGSPSTPLGYAAQWAKVRIASSGK